MILGDAAERGDLEAGSYLVNVAPGATTMSFKQLEHDVHLILARLREPESRS